MGTSGRVNPDVRKIVPILREAIRGMELPIVTKIAMKSRSPFDVLVSTVLSARTKDDVTRVAAERLLKEAPSPEDLSRLTTIRIEKLIYPVGFYRNKAKALKRMGRELSENFGSQVPAELEDLLKLSGVGRKTANLVLTMGFGKPGICVDTHVHRISNRLGYVGTKTPEATEMALRKKLPLEYWIEYNDLLVTYGQNVCRPISPFCSTCRIHAYCNRVGVTRSR
jgi:endonuclease III